MNAEIDFLQHALNLTRCNGEDDKRTSGREIVGCVCEQLGVPSASRRLILGVLSDVSARPRVPMALVYRYVGVGYRTWRRWMVTDPLFRELEITYRNPKNALLYVDELEAIFSELNKRKGMSLSVSGLLSRVALAQQTNKAKHG